MVKNTSKFDNNLKQGTKYEKMASDYFEYKTIEHKEKYFKEYDFIIDDDLKVEVKSEFYAGATNNFFIEFECNNKPSGITTTTADYFVLFQCFTQGFKDDGITYKPATHRAYKIKTSRLKKLIKKYGSLKIKCGDGMRTKGHILPIYKIPKKYIVENTATTEDLYELPDDKPLFS